MKKRRLLPGILAGAFMIVLILDNQRALWAASQAMELCIRTVIPAMLPFLFLTTILCTSWGGQRLPFLAPFSAFLGIPRGMEALLIPGFLGGYPLGAKAISDYYEKGLLSRETALRLLSFLSNAGPAFFIGILSACFPDRWMVFSLWGIHILSAFLVAALQSVKESARCKGEETALSLPHVMESSLKALGLICGWILCFRVLSAELEHWILWRLPDWLQALIIGLLELTNGCSKLTAVASVEIRYLLAAGLSGFGGLCVLMQTHSVLGSLPLSSYLLGKTLQALFSLLMAYFVIRGAYPVIFIIIMVSAALLLQNRGRKILRTGV